MCGRFVAMTHPDGLARFFTVDDRHDDGLAPSYNVAPTHDVAAVAVHGGRRSLVAFRWGLVPRWASDPAIGSSLINARAETAARTPAFRDSFARKRCLIAADGFYEWRDGPASAKTPHYVHSADEQPLAFAGLWASWRDSEQTDVPWLRTCTILTTAANARLSALHDRMPVVLPAHAWDEWLDPDHPDPDALGRLLVPAPDHTLAFHPVTPQANSPRNNHAGLLAPVAEQLPLI